jgi:hypothetical protein
LTTTICGGSSASSHIVVVKGGVFTMNGYTATITGTWNFTSGGCSAVAGVIDLGGGTFTGGTVTGQRYLAQLNGVIYGGAANCPGSTGGLTVSGGQAQ